MAKLSKKQKKAAKASMKFKKPIKTLVDEYENEKAQKRSRIKKQGAKASIQKNRRAMLSIKYACVA